MLGVILRLSGFGFRVSGVVEGMYSEGVGLCESPDLVAPLLDAEPGGGNLLLRARDIREQAESLQKLDVLATVERLGPGCGCENVTKRCLVCQRLAFDALRGQGSDGADVTLEMCCLIFRDVRDVLLSATCVSH